MGRFEFILEGEERGQAKGSGMERMEAMERMEGMEGMEHWREWREWSEWVARAHRSIDVAGSQDTR